jgi:hypothetical protein
MKRQAFQAGEIRDENDNIIRAGTYGKKSVFAAKTNDGILDYIINNFDAIFNMISGSYVYVADVGALPTTGDSDKIYVTKDDGKSWRWNSESYTALSSPIDGADGASAYEIAKNNGFSGTEAEWIQSLGSDTVASATVDNDGYLILHMTGGGTITTPMQPLIDAIQYKNAAKASQDAAKTSETNAKVSETAASASATNAKSSENAAKTSQTAAKSSETNAKASETAASTSAANAKSSENAAKASQTAAKTSETNAKTSETNAKTYADKTQEIKNSISSIYKCKGSVNYYSNLPTSGNEVGDTYNIINADTSHSVKAGDNMAWTGSAWDNLSGIVDLSAYATISAVQNTLTSYKATRDGSGNNIVNTYETITNANSLVKTVAESAGKVTVTTQGGTASTFYAGLNILQRNKVYSVGDIAYSPNLPSWAYLECVTAGTTGNAEPNFSNVSTGGGLKSDGTVQWDIHDSRCKYELGQIVPKLVTPQAHERLLLCDGSAFNTATYSQLAKIFTDGKTPNLIGRVLQGDTTAGNTKEAGLPNITGESYGVCYRTFSTLESSAVITSRENEATRDLPGASRGDWFSVKYNFDTSNSNVIYGNSSTVQPPAYTVKYYICYGG